MVSINRLRLQQLKALEVQKRIKGIPSDEQKPNNGRTRDIVLPLSWLILIPV
jgi:hypothetical protein